MATHTNRRHIIGGRRKSFHRCSVHSLKGRWKIVKGWATRLWASMATRARCYRLDIFWARDQDRRQIILGMSPQQLVSNPSYSRQQAGREGISSYAAGRPILLQAGQYQV